jgi:hypothetical protein
MLQWETMPRARDFNVGDQFPALPFARLQVQNSSNYAVIVVGADLADIPIVSCDASLSKLSHQIVGHCSIVVDRVPLRLECRPSDRKFRRLLASAQMFGEAVQLEDRASRHYSEIYEADVRMHRHREMIARLPMHEPASSEDAVGSSAGVCRCTTTFWGCVAAHAGTA